MQRKNGAATEEGGKINEQKLPNGDVKKSKKKHRENVTQNSKEKFLKKRNSKENVSGCCQGFNNEFFVAELDQNRVRKRPQHMKRKGWTNYQAGLDDWNKVMFSQLLLWLEQWQTIAMAYSFYRRSRLKCALYTLVFLQKYWSSGNSCSSLLVALYTLVYRRM